MTSKEAKSCIKTIEMLRRLAYNIHGVMDVIDAENCEKIIKALEQEPCDDAISRQAVFEKQYRIDDSATLSTRDVVNVEDIEDLPSVNPQEPKADRGLHLSQRFKDWQFIQEPKTDVLDKIRAEIKALSNANPSYWHSGDMVEREEVFEIIDKYTAESEG